MSRPYLQLHLLVLILAFTAILGKLIGLPAPALVLWRTGLAALGLLLWQALRKNISLKISTPDTRSDIFKALGTGIILGAHWMAFFGGIQLSNVSVCLAGMATTSFFTALTEPIIDRRRLNWSELALGVMVIPGLLLIVGFNLHHWLGLACALVSAFLASLFPVLNRRFALRGIAPEALTFHEMIGAFATCALVFPCFGFPPAALMPSAGDFLWLLILAGLCTVFAFSFHIYLLRHFTAFTTNLAVNFEPVYGILLAALIFREHQELHPAFYLGTLTILAANMLHVMIIRRRSKRVSRKALRVRSGS
jgi:drug/metabolite transporter (DMT)-like permease